MVPQPVGSGFHGARAVEWAAGATKLVLMEALIVASPACADQGFSQRLTPASTLGAFPADRTVPMMRSINTQATIPMNTTTTASVTGQPSSSTTCLSVLTWFFTLFNSVRVLAYLPTLWAIFTSGDSSQHSLLTWVTWVGANATMAAWLHEHNGRRANRAMAVNVCNTLMCLTTSVLIVAYRA
jgi:hypothetical protein